MAAANTLLPSDAAAPVPSSPPDLSDSIQLTITHHGAPHNLLLPVNTTISDLSVLVEAKFSIPAISQKFMISPKVGLLKPPFKDPTLPLSGLVGKKIQLLGSAPAEVQKLNEDIASSSSGSVRKYGSVKPATPARNRDWKKVQDEAIYTFTTLQPLPYLPNPQRSLRFLERLRDDPGIKASMRKHKWTVPLLTEMNPAEHTTHESRTLGLNRNRGEVIELRLRTDAYDGYRDYKTIRKTLCHELAHNVWGEHDRNFWNLCKDIEKEVERNDWKSGGHALSTLEFYNPDDDGLQEFDADHGGWTGGEFKLGSAQEVGNDDRAGLSRRDVMAKAAEERMKSARNVEKESERRERSP